MTFENRLVYEARDCGADHRSQPEQPELLKGPASDEQRGCSAARRIDRGVRHRDADQMDQREGEADGEACES